MQCFSGSDGDLAETLPVGASDYLACDDLEMVLLFRGLEKTRNQFYSTFFAPHYLWLVFIHSMLVLICSFQFLQLINQLLVLGLQNLDPIFKALNINEHNDAIVSLSNDRGIGPFTLIYSFFFRLHSRAASRFFMRRCSRLRAASATMPSGVVDSSAFLKSLSKISKTELTFSSSQNDFFSARVPTAPKLSCSQVVKVSVSMWY